MSLMEEDGSHDVAVMEMGMSGFGEIASMSKTATPDIAVITNVGSSHLEYLGSRENIAAAKGEIVEGLKKGGLLILDGDEPLLDFLKKKGSYRTQTVSLTDAKADFYGYHIRVVDGKTYFDLSGKGVEARSVILPTVGEHLVKDAVYAIAVGLEAGMDMSDIRKGLLAYRPASMRQTTEQVGGVTILADCYNAAPESMRAALDTLGVLATGRKIAVLGEMYELGADSQKMHEGVGAYAATHADMLFSVGKSGAYIADGAGGKIPTAFFADKEAVEEIAAAIVGKLQPGDTVLFKASRGVRIERVMESVKEFLRAK